MRDLEARLERLQRAVEGRTGPRTGFVCEDGSTWSTTEEPLAFLHQYGTITPDGRRIIAFRRPEGKHDPLSQSLIDLVGEAIKRGGFPWSEV